MKIAKDSIKKYYLRLCQLEKIEPIPIKFERVGKGGAALSYNSKTFEPLYISIDMNRLNDIEYGLYHEFAHQIALIKYKYPGHSDKFRKIFNDINDTYMYSKESKILFESILKEEFLGKIVYSQYAKDNSVRFDLYKNPTHIDIFEPNCRALSDRDGNLYVVDDSSHIIHKDIAIAVNFKYGPGKSIFNTLNFYDSYFENTYSDITWERIGKTNTFRLGESFTLPSKYKPNYNEVIGKLENKVELIKKKNPNLNFEIPEKMEIKENRILFSDLLTEVREKFTTLYHGTGMSSANNIKTRGIDIKYGQGGYFGWGFYTTPDYNLAKSNYANYAADTGGHVDTGAIIEFTLNDNANILDLRDSDDWDVWTKYANKISDRNFYKLMQQNKIDGLYDNSFEGVVIYNPKVLTMKKIFEI